jgi:hypothetical protein
VVDVVGGDEALERGDEALHALLPHRAALLVELVDALPDDVCTEVN